MKEYIFEVTKFPVSFLNQEPEYFKYGVQSTYYTPPIGRYNMEFSVLNFHKRILVPYTNINEQLKTPYLWAYTRREVIQKMKDFIKNNRLKIIKVINFQEPKIIIQYVKVIPNLNN